MNPRIKEVYPKNDYTLRIIFDNNEEKIFDVKPYLDKGLFKKLKDRSIFNSVKPFLGSIEETLHNCLFYFFTRHAKILSAVISSIFRALKFEHNALKKQNRQLCKGLFNGLMD